MAFSDSQVQTEKLDFEFDTKIIQEQILNSLTLNDLCLIKNP